MQRFKADFSARDGAMSFAEIARVLGVSEHAVLREYDNAINKILHPRNRENIYKLLEMMGYEPREFIRNHISYRIRREF